MLHVPKLYQQNPIEKESLLPECSSSLIELRSKHPKFFKQYFLMLFFFQHLTKWNLEVSLKFDFRATFHLFDSQLHQSLSWEKLNAGQNLCKPCPVYLFISVCLGGSWVTHTRISERNRTRECNGILHSRFGLHRLGLLSPDIMTQAF